MRYGEIPTIRFQLSHKIPQTHVICLPRVQTRLCLMKTGVQFLKQQIWLQRTLTGKKLLVRMTISVVLQKEFREVQKTAELYLYHIKSYIGVSF